MAHLVLVVISIALMAAMAVATISHIPADAVMRQSLQKEVDYGLRLLEFGVTRYLDAHRDTEGNIIYPGDGVNLKPLLTPQYSFIPANVRGDLTWEAVTAPYQGQPAVSICARPVGSSTGSYRVALENIQRTLPVGSAFVSSACGATTNDPAGDRITYWVVVSHVN